MPAALRIKATTPPPEVCAEKCWWRTRHDELAAQNKELRLELLKKRGPRPRATAAAAPDEPAAAPRAQPEAEVVDVLEQFRRNGVGDE